MFPSSKKSAFLAETKAARDLRQAEKNREFAATQAQKVVRGWLARQRLEKQILSEFDAQFPPISYEDEDKLALKPANLPLKPATASYRVSRRFLTYCQPLQKQFGRFETLCRYILASVESESMKLSYISVALSKNSAVSWISHMKTILGLCSTWLDICKLDSAKTLKEMTTILRMLITFTSTNTWAILNAKSMEKLVPGMNQLCANFMGHLVQIGFLGSLKKVLLRGLCASRIQLKKTALSAIMTLALRPVIAANFSNKLMSLFLLNIMSVPGLLIHLKTVASDSLNLLQKNEILEKSIAVLSREQELKIHFNALEGSYSLCLTGNLVQLMSNLTASQFEKIDMLCLVAVLTGLLESCGQYVTAKQSNLSHWHPVLGWFSVSLDSYLQASMDKVKMQMSLLWSPTCLKLLMKPLLDITDQLPELTNPPSPEPVPVDTNAAKQLFKKALQKTKTSTVPPPKGGYTKLGSPECRKIAMICNMYQNALKTLAQLKLEILAGLCYQNMIILSLWRLMQSFGPNCGLKAFLEHLSANSKGTAPEFQILILFCDCLAYLVTILDDIEMYEKQNPFTLNHYIQISGFVNTFLYKSISSGLINDTKSPLFTSLYSLLNVLYNRDNRRSYTRNGHWLIKDLRISSFLSDLEKCKKYSMLLIQKMPHIIPHEERVVLFRKKVMAEKNLLGLSDPDAATNLSTLVTIHRTRIVEDGYRQLSTLSSNALKGIIRVKFVNIQGLDEAGIDQDGVFKEFLEETIKKVFDPGLNLFCTTSEERLYPSPMSHMTDNHLHLFEFVGKMIGKAVYEGILFSFFFLLVIFHTALF